jgi:hypothetical protein
MQLQSPLGDKLFFYLLNRPVWCNQHAHYRNYAHYALSYKLLPPKNELYAHNAHYAHYVQEGCITLTQKA